MFNNSLIVDKFYQFILPNTAKVFAVCISAFVDALIVATLLGSEAMAIVNLGNPIILTVSTIGALLTVGGSTLYASACGAFDKPKADRIFSVVTYTALAISILLTLIAYLSRGTIVTWLCAGNLQLIDTSSSYIGILIGSMPVLTAANVLLTTLAARKSPVKIDWLIRQFPDRFILDIRSNVNSITEKQIPTPDNTKVTNEMVLGMNCLRMVSKS